LGKNAPLGAIKENASPKTPPTRDVMHTHAFDPASGFGAGIIAQHASHYYGQQQQKAFHASAHY